jgi:Formate hydrogenlyase subunit 6/NADH:ubiquinone oxidoreductase 23 kD subunit (chain I)
MSSYFGTIKRGAETVLGGLKITIEHFARATKRRMPLSVQDDTYFKQPLGLVTIQYPSEAIPTPPFSRYRLHNDAADCIACDQCARACPVQCITIKSFKATPDDLEELGTTSDGSKKKLWLEQFDIDMAKCMYCGYCTYPCPTECLTMTPVYDFSEFDRSNFIYHFGVLTKAKAEEKRAKLAKYEEEEKPRKRRHLNLLWALHEHHWLPKLLLQGQNLLQQLTHHPHQLMMHQSQCPNFHR